MRKFILYLVLSLFITQNVYADVKGIGRCIGYLTGKIMNEGQSSITQSNLKYMKKNNNHFQAVNKINKEQKNCIIPGKSFNHCLSSYSNYDAQLFIEMNHGFNLYNQARYDEAKKILYEMACSDNY